MSHSFKSHTLSDAEKLWLQKIYNSDRFDPRVAKVKLRDKLPRDFSPLKIDERLLTEGKHLTIIGVWHADPNSILLKDLETVIIAIKRLIIEKPGVETISAGEIASKIGLDEKRVQIAFKSMLSLGNFYSSATGGAEAEGFSEIKLSRDDSYDAYLNFENLEDLMEAYYNRPRSPHSPNLALSPNSPHTSYAASTGKWESNKNTAFILMAMDPSNPELEDVYGTIKGVCSSFGINAYRVDEIQPEDSITDRILLEIKTCEFLIADLSYERPNVYYEIGYAHANEKRPILFRKKGTRLHFDLSVHYAPEYKNITELRKILTMRFEAILGRPAK